MIRSLVPIFDIALAVLAFILAYMMRDAFAPPLQAFSFYVPLLIASVVFLQITFSTFRIYGNHRPILSFSYLIDFLKSISFWSVALVVFAFFTKTDYSRFVMAIYICLGGGLFFITRLFLAKTMAFGSYPKGDDEVHSMREKIVRVAAFSSDQLSLLEGVRRARAPSASYFILKRLIDVLSGFIGLFVVVPFLPIIIFLIKHDSVGPAIISQERIGKDGKPFTLYKFRTMKDGVSLYARSPKADDDMRVTNVGKWLRRFSIDEWPQFWNVLKGDMSVVGPRPEMPFIVETYSDWQKIRLSVKPGITGIWQILGRKDIPLEENIEYDLYYVFYQSIFLDLAIILRTIPHLLYPKGAY